MVSISRFIYARHTHMFAMTLAWGIWTALGRPVVPLLNELQRNCPSVY